MLHNIYIKLHSRNLSSRDELFPKACQKKKKKRYIFSLDLTTVTGDAHLIVKTAETSISLFRKHQSEEWSGVAHFNDIECMEADYLPHIQVQDHLRL